MQEKQEIPATGINGAGRAFLDGIYSQIRDPLSADRTMANLLDGLQRIRDAFPREEWQRFCRETVPTHRLARVIREDPFTSHSVSKPRGYAGDAELLDYIYGHRAVPCSEIGKAICTFTTNTPASRAVRNRATLIAQLIDRLARPGRPLRVLSIACGHLREADMSAAVRAGQVAEYVAFDQDADSLRHVTERLGCRNVRTLRGSIGDLLLGRHKELRGFDLVYAAGLYDYLSERLATRMTSWMFDATRPGGTTLLTNYLQGVAGTGYMEAFMEWELIYRTPEELARTAGRIPPGHVAERTTYHDPDNMVVFVELLKAVRTSEPLYPRFAPPHRADTIPQRHPVGNRAAG